LHDVEHKLDSVTQERTRSPSPSFMIWITISVRSSCPTSSHYSQERNVATSLNPDLSLVVGTTPVLRYWNTIQASPEYSRDCVDSGHCYNVQRCQQNIHDANVATNLSKTRLGHCTERARSMLASRYYSRCLAHFQSCSLCLCLTLALTLNANVRSGRGSVGPRLAAGNRASVSVAAIARNGIRLPSANLP
jgi:hypothetical protein